MRERIRISKAEFELRQIAHPKGAIVKLRAADQRLNATVAKARWGELSPVQLSELKWLTQNYKLSVALGDVQLLDRRWYVTHAGLLRLARRKQCSAIRTTLVKQLSDPIVKRWVFKATVYKRSTSKGFAGYGDADPSNVSSLVHGAEMRVAETRAVNRALRKAYGIGLCSVEELGSLSSSYPVEPPRVQKNGSHPPASHPCLNGQPRLRDRLCLLIRQHHLDASLVKSYAADYCGTATLREASRDLVEAFISHLAEWATKDREGLVSKLNSYAKSPEQELHA
jgi:hypothetical protein